MTRLEAKHKMIKKVLLTLILIIGLANIVTAADVWLRTDTSDFNDINITGNLCFDTSDCQNEVLDTCAEITGCVENAITDGNTNWDNSYGFFDSITDFIDSIVGNIGNWSADKTSYLTATQTNNIIAGNMTLAYNNDSRIDTRINTNNASLKLYIDTQDSAQDECSEISGCVVGAITDGNTNWDDIYGLSYGDHTNLTGTDVKNMVGNYSARQNDTDGYIYHNGDETKFNITKIQTQYFNATSVHAYRGTESGELAYINAYNGASYNVTEASGAEGLDFRINFTGITEFNQIIIRYKTTTGEAHTSYLQLWSYTDSDWENYGVGSEVADYMLFDFGVYDDTEHISGGTVQIRIYIPENGNTGHTHYFDWVTISEGLSTPSGAETDPYSIHRDGLTTLTGNWSAGNYKITAQYLNATTTSWANAFCYHNGTCLGTGGAESDPVWTADKPNYMTSALITSTISGNMTLAYTNDSRIDNRIDSNNASIKLYIDTQDQAQDSCAEITGCVENAITDGNTNWDNTYGFYNNIANITGLGFVTGEHTNLTETDVEGMIFDDDNTGTLNTTGNIVTPKLCLNPECTSYINSTCRVWETGAKEGTSC